MKKHSPPLSEVCNFGANKKDLQFLTPNKWLKPF